MAVASAARSSERAGRQAESHRACAANSRWQAGSVRHLDEHDADGDAGRPAGRAASAGDVRQRRGGIQGRAAVPAMGGGAPQEARRGAQLRQPRRAVPPARSAAVPPGSAAAGDRPDAATRFSSSTSRTTAFARSTRTAGGFRLRGSRSRTGTATPSADGRATRSWSSRTTSAAP